MNHSLSFILTAVLLFVSLPGYAKTATNSTRIDEITTVEQALFNGESSGHAASEDEISANGKSNSSLVIKKLPPPERERKGLSVMQAINKRKTNWRIKDEVISDQELSNVLWAAWGMVGKQKKHTTPSYMGATIAIYVSLPDGVWLYKPCKNHLEQILAEPIIEKYGLFTTELFYAIHPDDISYMLVGSVYQNVMLYCSSRGLYNALRASKIPLLEGKFPLPKDFKLVVSQGVGWPR